MASDRIPEAAYELGELREDFRVSQSELILSLLSIPIVLGLLGGIVLVRMPQILAPSNLLEWMYSVAGVLFAVGCIGSGVIAIARTYTQRHLRVLLFDEGLVYCHRDGVDVCRWDEVTSTTDSYIQDGKGAIRRFMIQGRFAELVFDETIAPMNDFHRMVETIDARVAEQLLPQAAAELSVGKCIDCGTVQLTADGIMHDNRLLPWSEFEWIGSRQCYVAIEQSGASTPWASVPSGDIKNKHLLIELATQFSKSGEYALTS